ncbi:autotransporter domain-containing protein [Microbacteriaceae bacterium K1510]|nr:autotransporter domain-containing protein [Microbacteriaceae bacterium K1510]
MVIYNFGTILSGNRGIDTSGANPPRSLTLENAAGALISTVDDAFRLNTSIGNGTVTVNNAGTIVSTTAGQVFDFANNTSTTGTININNSATGVLRALANDVIRPGSGATVITNNGLIDATNSSSRAINLNPADLSTVTSLQIFNNAGATIQSQDDAIRATGTAGTTTTTGWFLIDNAGTIKTVGTGSGQAIDFDNIASTSATVTIINRASGLITAGDADAIRPGQNFTITNYGQIIAYANPVPTDRPSADAIDLQLNHTGTVYNYGLISGAKSGTASDVGSSMTVYNYAGATIIGRNGSGIGSGGTATVVNYGTITGTIDSTSARGDGDGIDVDFAANITNYGLIQGLGSKGYDAGNRLNNSEGLAIGGGVINNYGTITGQSSGIVVNNDSNTDGSRSGSAATTLTNYAGATIIGQNAYAIRFENKTGTTADNDTIVNRGTIIGNGAIPNPNATILLGDGSVDPAHGTLNGVTYGAGSARFIRGDGSAIQMGEGADTLINYGTIIGNNGRAINLEGGNDTMVVMPGSKIVGLVDGGANDGGTGNVLKYYKVGLSAQKIAALQAGQTVNIGGTLYVNFQSFSDSTVRSFSSYATSGATSGIASAFDNMTGVANINTQTLIDQVASASNVTAALAQLTPTAFQAFTTAGFNNAFQTTTLAGNRLSNVRDGILAFDASNVDTVAALVNGEMPRTVGEAVANAYAANASMAQNPAFAAMAKAGGGVTKAPRMIEGDTPWGMFLYGNALFARQNATSNAPQTKFNAAGFTAGVDYRLTPDLVVGVLGGYTRTNADLDTLGSTSKINTWLLGAYGTYYRQNWFVNGAFVYGRNSYDNNRIALGTSNTSSPKGDQYAVQGTVGVDLRYGGWIVTPELGAQYTMVRVDAFTETGAAALAVDGDKADSFRSSLGARFRYDWQTDFGIVTPELRASWQHEFLDKERDIRASFVDQSLPGTFATTAAGSGTDFGIVGAGLTANIVTRMQMMLGYDFKFGGHDFQAHQLSGRLRYVF